jgi:hypothetical protein
MRLSTRAGNQNERLPRSDSRAVSTPMPQRRSADHRIPMYMLLQESLKSREFLMHWLFE